MNPKILLTVTLYCLLSACASQPPPEVKNHSGQDAMLAMMLLASASNSNKSTESNQFEVKISPPALEMLLSISKFRVTNNKWPTRNDITEPKGIAFLSLGHNNEKLDIGIKNDDQSVIQCSMLPDGTIVFNPFGSAIKAFEAMKPILNDFRQNTSPSPHIYIPPIR